MFPTAMITGARTNRLCTSRVSAQPRYYSSAPLKKAPTNNGPRPLPTAIRLRLRPLAPKRRMVHDFPFSQAMQFS